MLESPLVLVFVTGLLTGIHCMAMCGSFVVSYIAGGLGDNKGGGRHILLQHVAYNGARIFSYTAVGAALGLLGSVFTISLGMRGAISILAGAFMVLLGLQMLNIFPALRKLRLHIGVRQPQNADLVGQSGSIRPALFLGLWGGLMPCGPLQAMELYAAGTGSALQGAIVMLVFGIGNLPVLMSFGLVTSHLLSAGRHFELKQRLLKVSAIVVIVLGLIMLNRGLALNGIQFGLPILGGSPFASSDSGGVQKLNLTVDGDGYHPATLSAKRGVPLELWVFVKKRTGCNRELVLPNFGIDAMLPDSGESTVLRFTPGTAGSFPFTCGMGMLHGTIIVT